MTFFSPELYRPKYGTEDFCFSTVLRRFAERSTFEKCKSVATTPSLVGIELKEVEGNFQDRTNWFEMRQKYFAIANTKYILLAPTLGEKYRVE